MSGSIGGTGLVSSENYKIRLGSDKMIDRQMDDRQIDREIDRQIDRQMDDRQIDRQMDEDQMKSCKLLFHRPRIRYK